MSHYVCNLVPCPSGCRLVCIVTMSNITAMDRDGFGCSTPPPPNLLLNRCKRLHVFTSVTMQPEPLCGALSPESILQLPPLLWYRSVHTSVPILVSWTVGRAAKRVPGVSPHKQLHRHVAVRVAIRGTYRIGCGSVIVLPSTYVHTGKKIKTIGLHSQFCPAKENNLNDPNKEIIFTHFSSAGEEA